MLGFPHDNLAPGRMGAKSDGQPRSWREYRVEKNMDADGAWEGSTAAGPSLLVSCLVAQGIVAIVRKSQLRADRKRTEAQHEMNAMGEQAQSILFLSAGDYDLQRDSLPALINTPAAHMGAGDVHANLGICMETGVGEGVPGYAVAAHLTLACIGG